MIQQLNPHTSEVFYPESDGKPLADNTIQFELITTIKLGLEAQFRNDPNVFIAGDLLWYPVEGHPEISQAPDVMVAFGRPKGHRRSYLQWEEGGINPQVTFEIASHNNTRDELENKKREFYQRHGVEEYYLFYPEKGNLKGWQRQNNQLKPIKQMQGWVSPRLGIRFEVVDKELQVYHPDGERFTSYVEVVERAEVEAQRAERERQRAQRAESALETTEEALEQERNRVQILLEQLRARGIDPSDLDLG